VGDVSLNHSVFSRGSIVALAASRDRRSKNNLPATQEIGMLFAEIYEYRDSAGGSSEVVVAQIINVRTTSEEEDRNRRGEPQKLSHFSTLSHCRPDPCQYYLSFVVHRSAKVRSSELG